MRLATVFLTVSLLTNAWAVSTANAFKISRVVPPSHTQSFDSVQDIGRSDRRHLRTIDKDGEERTKTLDELMKLDDLIEKETAHIKNLASTFADMNTRGKEAIDMYRIMIRNKKPENIAKKAGELHAKYLENPSAYH